MIFLTNTRIMDQRALVLIRC